MFAFNWAKSVKSKFKNNSCVKINIAKEMINIPTGVRLTDEKKQFVADTYLEKPMTIEELSGLCNLSVPTVIKILNEYGIERYNKSLLFSPDLDEYYFDNINSEAKAYFLGFIITDGNVFIPKDNNRQASISITQKSEDDYILKKFKEEIQTNTAIAHDGRGCS